MNARKPILITGSHRSGSTWVGKILAAAKNTAYVHEPFNVDIRIGCLSTPFPYQYYHVCRENEAQFKQRVERVIKLRYPLLANLKKIRRPGNLSHILKDLRATHAQYANSDTPIVKDPLALFSAEWLAQTFDMKVVVMIRHPAAFCSSLKLKDWQFDFNQFLQQPLLMQHYLSPFEREIREQATTQKDIISQGILLWNCIHHTIHEYEKKHSDWMFIKHENLSLIPLVKFSEIYQECGLNFTPEIESAILLSSGEHNPSEQKSGSEFVRNSKENIYNWKNRLSDEDIQRIKQGTAEVASHFYDASEW